MNRFVGIHFLNLLDGPGDSLGVGNVRPRVGGHRLLCRDALLSFERGPRGSQGRGIFEPPVCNKQIISEPGAFDICGNGLPMTLGCARPGSLFHDQRWRLASEAFVRCVITRFGVVYCVQEGI